MKRRDVNRVYGLPWTLRLRLWPERRRYERARRAAGRERERYVRELQEVQRRIAASIPLDDPDGGLRAD